MITLTEDQIFAKEASLELMKEELREDQETEAQLKSDCRNYKQKVRLLEREIEELRMKNEQAYIEHTNLGFTNKNKAVQIAEVGREVESAWENFYVKREIQSKTTFFEQLRLILEERSRGQTSTFQDFASMRDVNEVMDKLEALYQGKMFTAGALALRTSQRMFDESLEKLCRKKVKKMNVTASDLEAHQSIFDHLLRQDEIEAIWMVANEQAEEFVIG